MVKAQPRPSPLLQHCRESLGFSRHALGKAAGISVEMIRDLEEGRAQPTGQDGYWRPSALRLTAFHCLDPRIVWPDATEPQQLLADAYHVFEDQQNDRRAQETRVFGRECYPHLRLALGQLNDDQRQAVLLYSVEGYTHKEVADALCLSSQERARQLYLTGWRRLHHHVVHGLLSPDELSMERATEEQTRERRRTQKKKRQELKEEEAQREAGFHHTTPKKLLARFVRMAHLEKTVDELVQGFLLQNPPRDPPPRFGSLPGWKTVWHAAFRDPELPRDTYLVVAHRDRSAVAAHLFTGTDHTNIHVAPDTVLDVLTELEQEFLDRCHFVVDWVEAEISWHPFWLCTRRAVVHMGVDTALRKRSMTQAVVHALAIGRAWGHILPPSRTESTWPGATP